MVLPLILGVGAAFACTWAPQMAAKAVLSAEFLGGRNAKREREELKRESSLGLNSAFVEFKVKRKMEIVLTLGGDPSQVSGDFSFQALILKEDMLPDDQKHRAGEYVLTEEEMEHLMDAVQHDLTSFNFAWAKQVTAARLADSEFGPLLRERLSQLRQQK